MAEKTEFNMSVATLIRIDQLLTSANSFKVSNDIYKWFLVMLGLYAELSVFIPEDMLLIFEEKIKQFSLKFSQIQNDIINDQPYNVSLNDYLDLLHFEINLRTIAKDNGLLIKFKEDFDENDF